MRADVRALVVVLVLALASAAVGCGSGEQPVRIGVVADCRGLLGGLNDAMVSGAELPLIRRGARLRGVEPGDGLEHASVAGRPVELLTGCSEVGEFSVLVEETRRLIELEHADVVVGGIALGSGEGIVLRDLARRYPNVAFVVVGTPRREVTLVRPAPNLFRFESDYAQSVAGLGTYAYEQLGWRRAAIVADDADAGWAEAAAFTAEFCALGGTIVERDWLSSFDPGSRRLPRTRADGIAALVSSFTAPPPYVQALVRQVGDPASRLVLGPAITQDPAYSSAVGSTAAGATTSTSVPPPFPTPGGRAFERAYRRAFPTLPAGFADGALTHLYYDGVEPVVRALDAVHGDIGADGERLREALARVRIVVPGGTIALDRQRQAVAPTVLLRIVRGSGGKGLAFRPIRTVGPVDQSVGGTLRAREIGRAGPGCRRQRPAPWAGR
jgi:branched-chain amino acid transport system substrate-binding protein